MYSKAKACFKHSNFFKVIDLEWHNHTAERESSSLEGKTDLAPALTTETRAGQASHVRNPTTSFLTATTLIYATGAGITAAAGTRLALQWIIVKGFKLYSFQFPNLVKLGIVIYCHYLLVLRLGNLRGCCLPWMWSPFLGAASPESNPNSPSPVNATVVHYTTVESW